MFARTYDVVNDRTVIVANVSSIQLFPGQSFDIVLRVIDSFGQIVTDFPGMTVKISSSNTLQGSGFDASLDTVSKQGTVVFYGLDVLGAVGSTAYLKFQSPLLVNVLQVPVTFGSCPKGYKSANTTCLTCPKGYYNMNNASSTCLECPKNAECEGTKVLAKQGYWTFVDPNTNVASVYFCVNHKCKGGNVCEDNRNGSMPLCGVCNRGFTEWNGVCLKCESPDGGLLMVYILYLFVMFLMQHTSAQNTKSGASKVFWFFGQTATLIIGSNQIMGFLRTIFEFELVVGTGTSIDRCPFPRNSYFYFFTAVMQCLGLLIILLIFVFFASVFNTIICCIQAKWRNLLAPFQSLPETSEELLKPVGQNEASEPDPAQADEPKELKKRPKLLGATDRMLMRIARTFYSLPAYAISFFNLFIVTYQILASVALNYFACVKVGDSRYVLQATDIECGSEEHKQWYGLYISILVYVSILPVVLFVFLFAFRNKLKNETFERYFGVFYRTYKQKYYWYEAFSLARRTIIIAVIVLFKAFFDYAVELQYIIIAIVLSIFFIIQRALKPFVISQVNSAELMSLFVLILIALIRGSFTYVENVTLAMIFILVLLVPTILYLIILVVSHSFFKKIIVWAWHWLRNKILQRRNKQASNTTIQNNDAQELVTDNTKYSKFEESKL